MTEPREPPPAPEPEPEEPERMRGKDLRIDTTPEELARAVLRGGEPRRDPEPDRDS